MSRATVEYAIEAAKDAKLTGETWEQVAVRVADSLRRKPPPRRLPGRPRKEQQQ